MDALQNSKRVTDRGKIAPNPAVQDVYFIVFGCTESMTTSQDGGTPSTVLESLICYAESQHLLFQHSLFSQKDKTSATLAFKTTENTNPEVINRKEDMSSKW